MLKRSDVLIFIHGNDESAGKAFRSIYEEYSKLIRFVAGKYLDVEADVDDVVIELFVSLYESRKKVRDIKYYLVTTAKNKAINLLKKRKREISTESDAFEQYASGSREYSEIVSQIYAIVGKTDGDILIAHIVEGYSLKELALRYEISLSAMKSRYRRSIAKLNSELEKRL